MTTFIKTKFNISDDQTNIDKYKLAANIIEYHIISKLILQRIIITNFYGPVSHLRLSTISDLNPHRISNSKKFFLSNRSINKKLDFLVQWVIWGKGTVSHLESTSNFQVKGNFFFKSVHKQEIGHLGSSESFEVEYNIGFWIPIEFQSQRKKNIQIGR